MFQHISIMVWIGWLYIYTPNQPKKKNYSAMTIHMNDVIEFVGSWQMWIIIIGRKSEKTTHYYEVQKCFWIRFIRKDLMGAIIQLKFVVERFTGSMCITVSHIHLHTHTHAQAHTQTCHIRYVRIRSPMMEYINFYVFFLFQYNVVARWPWYSSFELRITFP